MRLKKREWAILSIPLIVTGLLLAGSGPQASPRLVSVQHIPESLQWCDESGGTNARLIASLQKETLSSVLRPHSAPILMAALQQRITDLPNTAQQEREAAEARAKGARVPIRTIRDTAPTYSAVAVDVNSDDVILQDNNLWSYRVF